MISSLFGSIFQRVVNGSLFDGPILGRSSYTKIFCNFRHDIVDTANVAYFENSFILNIDVVRNEIMMDISSLVNIVEPYSYLKEAVHQSFGVQVFILITEKALGDEISEGPAFKLLQKY